MKNFDSEIRPWGRYYILSTHDNYKVKKIEVKIGQRLSYQFHNKRSEVWTIVEGTALVTLDDKKIKLKKGESVQIPLKSKHRVENIGDKILTFIEVQTGDYFGEDDIVRLEDDYNRK